MQLARDIVGRMMADPAFIQKLALEEVFTIGTALYWEVQQRRERFTKELDFVAINTLSLAAATGALVWLMSPNRASGVLKVSPLHPCTCPQLLYLGLLQLCARIACMGWTCKRCQDTDNHDPVAAGGLAETLA